MKLKELPKAPIQIQRDNLLIEVEQLKTALLQKDNIITSKSNTITELQNQLSIQSNLVTRNSAGLATTEQALNSKILECNTLDKRIAAKDLIISEKQNTITQLQSQIVVERLSIQEKEALIVTVSREKASLVEEHRKSIEELREQLEDHKLLILQKESSLREIESLAHHKDLSINELTERINDLDFSCKEFETDLLQRDSTIKTIEEDNHKKELVIKELENSLLKKDLIIHELENQVAISEIKTAPIVNSELILLKEQLADKNLIIELLKSQKLVVSGISLKSEDLKESNSILQDKNTQPFNKGELINFTKPIFFNLEDLPQAESILLSGDVSLIEEESI